MSKDLLDSYQKLSQLALENLKKLGETNLKVGEKLLAEQVELTNSLLETASAAPALTEVKDLKDVAAWQAEWAQEYTKKVVETSRNYADIVAEAGKVYTSLFDAAVKSATAVSEKATATTKKKAA